MTQKQLIGSVVIGSVLLIGIVSAFMYVWSARNPSSTKIVLQPDPPALTSQLKEMEMAVNRLNTSLEEHERRVDGLNTKLSQAEREIAGFQQRAESAEEKLSRLERKLAADMDADRDRERATPPKTRKDPPKPAARDKSSACRVACATPTYPQTRTIF